jgi:hypothetical protein
MSGDDKPPRRLSDDDEALWHSITRSIVPLKRRRVRRSEPESLRAAAKPQVKQQIRLAPNPQHRRACRPRQLPRRRRR